MKDTVSSPRTATNHDSLYVLRDGALETLSARLTFPDDFHETVKANLRTFVGEEPLVLGSWSQSDHVDRPALLGFDDSGSLLAIVLADGKEEDLGGRLTAVSEWLQALSLRDVLKMHSSIDVLMDSLLANNPDELHLTLGSDRRLVMLALVGGERELLDHPGVSATIGLEMYPGDADSVIVRRVATPPAPVIAPPIATEIAEAEQTTEADPESLATPVIAETPETPEIAETPETTETTETAQTPVVTETPQPLPVQSSLAPPPGRNSAVEAAIEPGAVSFKQGSTMRTADLNSYLADKTGAPEEVGQGCVASGKHVLLTEVLSSSRVLESRGHYHRAIDEEFVNRFREWYDGSIPKVTFHLLVQSEDNLDETTYVGRIKPTAWEHRSGGETLLFRVVPRVASELWVKLSAGEVPEMVVDAPADDVEPWPVVPAKASEPTSRRRGVRRLR